MTAPADRIQLDPGWKKLLLDEFSSDYMADLRAFLVQQRALGQIIYPASSQWFAALNKTPFETVRVVIIGQDPYHGPKQAHGLCFSVKNGVPLPPSLQNIFREMAQDLLPPEGQADFRPAYSDLTPWAEQGVLLLNSVLTVAEHKPGSHRNKGWERFTDKIVSLLATKKEHLVFMLWGSYAQHKGSQIDRLRHLVLTAPHPSPLSAHRGFFGSSHFSKCNQYLARYDLSEINWLH